MERRTMEVSQQVSILTENHVLRRTDEDVHSAYKAQREELRKCQVQKCFGTHFVVRDSMRMRVMHCANDTKKILSSQMGNEL